VCGLLGGLLKQDLLKAAQDRSFGSSPINHTDADIVKDRDPGQRQEPSELAEHQQAGQAARILVVDDIPENRMLLEVILSKLGYAPIQCSGGLIAVELCRQEKFDLILMDIQMPDMNGLEAAKQIRTDSLNAAIPIIAMTASDRKDDEMTALGSGCDDYMTKPINRKLLEQKIWRNLAKMRQIREAELGHEIVSFLDGDPDYHKTIETFVGNLPSRIEEMRRALEAHNLKELAFKVHALKGLGGFAGFSVYTEKAARIEDSLRHQDVDKIQQQIDEMIQMCVRTTIKSNKGSE
jgi:CheY-like chemotaxis protein